MEYFPSPVAAMGKDPCNFPRNRKPEAGYMTTTIQPRDFCIFTQFCSRKVMVPVSASMASTMARDSK